MTTSPYAGAAEEYRRHGWAGVLPVVGKAGNLPDGYTGFDGIDPAKTDVEMWVAKRGADNVCLRMPATVVGIDVDAYGPKRGRETLAKATAKWGMLPDTWRSTARAESDNLSGIYFYRVPFGTLLVGRIELDGSADIEIVQRSHRYAIVAPSQHPDTGGEYRWYPPAGIEAGIPVPSELPELPAAWLEGLGRPEPLPKGEAVEVPPMLGDVWAVEVRAAHAALVGTASGDVGSRHDRAMSEATALARLERRGFEGATTALLDAAFTWAEAMADDRGIGTARQEIESIIVSAREVVARTPTLADADAWLGLAPDPTDPPTPVTPEVNRHRLAMMDELGVGSLVPPDPVIDGWLFKGTLAALYAPPGMGKSFVAIDWAMSVATGAPWCEANVEHGNVVYALGEGVAGMGKRLRSWRFGKGVEGEARLAVLPHVPQLGDPQDVADFIDAIVALEPVLVVIDTLARAAVGIEENSAKEMGAVVAAADRIKELTGACVLLVHHTGKDADRGLRGSSALNGAVDTAIAIDGDVALMHLKTTKQKDAEPARPIHLRGRTVGESLVLEQAEPPTGEGHVDRELTEAKLAVARVVRSIGAPETLANIVARCEGAANAKRAALLMVDEGALVEVDRLRGQPVLSPNLNHHLFAG